MTKRDMIRNQGVFFCLFLTLALFAWNVSPSAAKEDWPTKQIDFVNPFGAGGAADVQARKLAEIVSRDLSQPLVVRNVTGAGGAIAYNEVRRLWFGIGNRPRNHRSARWDVALCGQRCRCAF